MVQVGTEALSIDHGLTVVQSIKVSAGNAIVPSIGFFHGDALTGILDNAGSFANGGRGVDADGMNGRRAND